MVGRGKTESKEIAEYRRDLQRRVNVLTSETEIITEPERRLAIFGRALYEERLKLAKAVNEVLDAPKNQKAIETLEQKIQVYREVFGGALHHYAGIFRTDMDMQLRALFRASQPFRRVRPRTAAPVQGEEG